MSEFFYDIVIEAIVTNMEKHYNCKNTNGQRHGSICLLQNITGWNQSLHTVTTETTTKLIYRSA